MWFIQWCGATPRGSQACEDRPIVCGACSGEWDWLRPGRGRVDTPLGLGVSETQRENPTAKSYGPWWVSTPRTTCLPGGQVQLPRGRTWVRLCRSAPLQGGGHETYLLSWSNSFLFSLLV